MAARLGEDALSGAKNKEKVRALFGNRSTVSPESEVKVGDHDYRPR